MKFSEIINPTQIILDLKATDRWTAIEEIVNHLTRTHQDLQKQHDTILAAIKHREENMSTAIGFGVAIPHASTSAVGNVTSILARSSAGIDYDSLDAQPVKIMVLLLTPVGHTQEHLRTLANISRFMNNRDFREKAENAKTAEEIYQLIVTKEV
jgi:mannitol/fructose-specific phosphotransferase system IIA component (Ntr-type)